MSAVDPHQDPLAPLALGFRTAYLDHETLTRQLEGWHAAFPEITRLVSMGRTHEGRDVWCLIIGRDPDAARPAAWVDGNMHAPELAGSSVCLAIAEDVLRLHAGLAVPDVPPAVADAVRAALIYVVPRISPDGAETVLATGRFVRSTPVEDRHERGAPWWRALDLNGDGFIGRMRVPHPDGELVESTERPGLMLPREIEHAGPFYKVYPEGVIENFDGRGIPNPSFLSDNRYDLNRTFPWTWAPEHIQLGAGDYPGAMPETRAVLEFTRTRAHIHVWMDYHCFGGVYIRPLGDQPDTRMNQADLGIYRELEAWAQRFTGYPTVSGFEDFLYQPDTPLRGDMSDYAYHQRGAMSVVCELWDLFTRLGIPPTKPFAKVYEQLTPEHHERLAAWDAAHNGGRIFRPWVPFEHPQLGPVELGGYDTRVGVWNPPEDQLDGLCRAQTAVFLRMAALLPRVVIEPGPVVALGGDVFQVDVRVRNAGYLATYGLPSAKALPFSEPLRLTVVPGGGDVTLVSPAESVLELGHLEGWGRGRHSGDFGFAALETHGTDGERTVRLVLRRTPGATGGRARLTVAVTSPRTGRTEVELTLPEAGGA